MTRTDPPTDLAGAVWLRRQLLEGGWTDRGIAEMRRSGRWHRIRHGAYCDGPLFRSLGDADRHRLRARAVLLAAHPSTVLTHASAAIEHGAPVWGVDLGVVHVTRTDGRAGRRTADVTYHRAALPPSHVVVARDVPVSMPTRALVEMTTITGVESALVTADGLLHAGLATREDAAALVRDFQYWPRSLTADMVIRLSDPRRESPGESRFFHLCFTHSLPAPQPQVEVRDRDGSLLGRVDFAWPDHGVFVEFDGRAKYHLYRRPGETLEDYLLRQQRREERICLATGWVCIRLAWSDLESGRRTAARIRALLDQRRPSTA